MTQRRDAQERERKRLHLLEVAASEFARVGFDQANINTISERAGFGKGTVYLYTASKEQLFLDVLQEIGSTTTAALDTALQESEGKPVAVRLEALVAAFARLAADHPDFVRLQASALFGVNRRFQDACAQVLQPVVQHLAEAFATAVRDRRHAGSVSRLGRGLALRDVTDLRLAAAGAWAEQMGLSGHSPFLPAPSPTSSGAACSQYPLAWMRGDDALTGAQPTRLSR